jgi:hypothetical protein
MQYTASKWGGVKDPAHQGCRFGRDYGSSLVRLRLAPHDITARVSFAKLSAGSW